MAEQGNKTARVYSLASGKLGWISANAYNAHSMKDNLRLTITLTATKLMLLGRDDMSMSQVEDAICRANGDILDRYTDEQINAIGNGIWNIISDIAVGYMMNIAGDVGKVSNGSDKS